MNYIKSINIGLIVFVFFTTCRKNSNDICVGFENSKYCYTIYKCTDEDSLVCYQKVINSVLLPDKYLACSSTDSLACTCLNYPFLSNIWLYNSIQQGFEHVLNIFNGFDELFIRDDVNIELLKIYQAMDPADINNYSDLSEQGEFMSKFIFVEITLAQLQLIDKLTQEEVILSLEISLDKYYKKELIPSYNDSYEGQMGGLALMARILYTKNFEPFVQGVEENEDLMYFIESADFTGITNIESISQFIISNSEICLNEFKNYNK